MVKFDTRTHKVQTKKEKTVHQVYDKILKKEIYPLLGNKTTFLDDLNGASKKLLGVKFKGVFPSDRIPKLNDLTPYCILNLDKQGEPGSHWVSLANMPNSDDSMLYDSFGRSHIKIIPSLRYSGNGRIINDTDDAEQQVEQTDCGARSLAWLIFFDRFGAENALLI